MTKTDPPTVCDRAVLEVERLERALVKLTAPKPRRRSATIRVATLPPISRRSTPPPERISIA